MKKSENLIKRDRGVLTEHDRRYLLNELGEELSENAEYQKRYQIRNRIRNAVLDFQIIQGQLSFKDIELIFEPTYDWARQARLANEDRTKSIPAFPEFANHWSAIIQFFVFSQLYSKINESHILAKHVVEEGVSRALRQYGFDFTNEFYQSDVTLQGGVENRYRLMNYLDFIEDSMPSIRENADEYLYDLYISNYLTYSMYVYLYEKQFG